MSVEGPDGLDVVGDWAQAETLERPPLLVLDSVTEYFDGQGLGEGAVRWERIGEGQSNITFLIERGDARFVLRRGPRPPLPPSAHDMVREARVQRILGRSGVPVPEIVDVCQDDRVLGVPFYVMDYVDGLIITDSIPPILDGEESRRATTEAVVDALVALHSIDVSAGELASLGRPAGYLERQVGRFAKLWPLNTRRTIPQVAEIGEWLGRNIPVSQGSSVVHGDFRMGNLMFARAQPPRVSAILDWEMATLGDPLADLGYLTATYAEPGSLWTPMELTSVTREPGYLTRNELVARYGRTMPYDLEALPWYQALALWKAAIFCEAIYTRYVDGQRPGDTFGPRLDEGVPLLLRQAAEIASIPVSMGA